MIHWINVEDDLPPPNIKCLVVAEVTVKNFMSFETKKETIILEAYFSPNKGWITTLEAQVFYWGAYPETPAEVKKILTIS